MAVVTAIRASLPTAVGPCVLSYTFDDVTGLLAFVTLDTPVEATVRIRRGTGVVWLERVAPAGVHVAPSGGPVKVPSDIPDIELACRVS